MERRSYVSYYVVTLVHGTSLVHKQGRSRDSDPGRKNKILNERNMENDEFLHGPTSRNFKFARLFV